MAEDEMVCCVHCISISMLFLEMRNKSSNNQQLINTYEETEF